MTPHAEQATQEMSKEITITRIVDAPRELVFKACTEAEQLAKWWGPEGFTAPLCESDPRPGGVLKVVMRGPDGVEFPMNALYREVVEPERLVVESTAVGEDGEPVLEAVTTITFADLGGNKTEITVNARAEALVPDAAMMLGGMEAGWTQSLQCLDDVLTGAVDRQIVMMRLLQAPRELVFKTFTEEEHVAKWWGPTGFTLTTHEMDVRPGGVWEFTMHGPDGVDYPNTIAYDEVTPPARLHFIHGPEPTFDVTITFDDFMGMTAATWRMVFDTAEARDETIEKYNAIEGGNQTADRLVAYLVTLVDAPS